MEDKEIMLLKLKKGALNDLFGRPMDYFLIDIFNFDNTDSSKAELKKSRCLLCVSVQWIMKDTILENIKFSSQGETFSVVLLIAEGLC